MYFKGENYPERKYDIAKGLEKYPSARYEEVSLSKLIIASKINVEGLTKIKTLIPPRVKRNRFGEYLVVDGRHRLFNFYLDHLTQAPILTVGCLVEDDPQVNHYSGFYLWQIAESIPHTPRRSWARKMGNYFGLFLPQTEFFILDPQTTILLDLKTKLIIHQVEDKLDHLYSDYTARICQFLMIIDKNSKESSVAKIKRQFEQYTHLLASLQTEENTEKSLLYQLRVAISKELTKPALKDNLHLQTILASLDGFKNTPGLIDHFAQQLLIIRTGKITNKDKLEVGLINELKIADSFLEKRRQKLFKLLVYSHS